MDTQPLTPLVSICQVESNLPGEDRYCIRVTEDIFTYGVYDGHGGYLAADMACATLQDLIIKEISAIPVTDRNNLRVASVIDAAFIACDERILDEALLLHRSCKETFNGHSISRGNSEKGFLKSPRENSANVEAALIGKQRDGPKVMGRAGSCAVVAIITGGILFVAHVG